MIVTIHIRSHYFVFLSFYRVYYDLNTYHLKKFQQLYYFCLLLRNFQNTKLNLADCSCESLVYFFTSDVMLVSSVK